MLGSKHTRRWSDVLGRIWLCGLLSLGACTLQEPAPAVAPAVPPAILEALQTMRQELTNLRQDIGSVQQTMQTLPALSERVSKLEMFPQVPASGRKGSQKRSQAPSPTQLITEAQKTAQVEPSVEGFWGHSAEQVYTWQPGRVFLVYICWSHPTLIALPPGERAMVGLELDKETYNVTTELVGADLTAYTAITIRPLFEKGEADALIVTDVGKRYLFHFIVGKVGMLAVTFETPSLHQTFPHEPPLPPAKVRP